MISTDLNVDRFFAGGAPSGLSSVIVALLTAVAVLAAVAGLATVMDVLLGVRADADTWIIGSER